ncbi:hypothetical protein ONZ45_g4680 [Pleurotus djamor]|nr:hypothetical protein ONZ45_g4680 [Pleurotus djamor]
MQISMKFIVLAVLVQVSDVFASPIAEEADYTSSLAKRATRAECEGACTMLVLAGSITQAQWQGCVENCMARGLPTPPPTPPPAPAPLPQQNGQRPTKNGGKKGVRSVEKRATRAECEGACTMLVFAGSITQAQWQGCVENCMARGLPTPPPSPPRQKGGKKKVRSVEKRATRAECEGACTMLVLAGQLTQAGWQGCVENCMARGLPTPPPSPPRTGRKGGRSLDSQEEGSLSKRANRAECEGACTMLVLAGQLTQAGWQNCVENCMARGLPTPPPSPPRQKAGKKARRSVGEEALSKRATRAECEGACTMLVLAGQLTQAGWQQCVENCMARGLPTPPPSPPRQQKPRPRV